MPKSDSEKHLEKCIREHGERAWRLAMSWMRHTSDADDVVQRAFIVVASKIKDLPKTNAWPWLASIIVNEARNARRINVRRTQRLQLGKDGEMASVPDPHVLPDQAAARRETQERYLEAIEQLPDQQREAILLTHVMGMSVREAASSLKVAPSTLDARVQRGIESLRNNLKLSEGGLVSMSSMLVFTPPPGGIGTASAAWLTTAKASLTLSAIGASASSGVIGGIVMANKVVATASLTLALGIGIVVGAFGSDLLEDNPKANLASTQNEEQPEVHQTTTESKPRYVSLEAYQALEQELTNARAMERDLADDTKRLQGTISKLTDAKKALEAQVSAATEQPATTPTALRGEDLAISFGNFGDEEVLREMDWDKVGQAIQLMVPLLNDYVGALRRGEKPDGSLLSKVQKHNGVLVQAAIKLSGKLPTQFQGNVNGEFTHPIMVINTMAAHLEEEGHPFNERQLQDLSSYGSEYVENWLAKEATYTEDTLSLEKVVDELELKHQTINKVKNILTPSQYTVLYPQDVEGVHTFDVYSPIIMMIMSVEKGASGKNAVEMREALVKQAMERWGLDDAQINSASFLLSNWADSLHSVAIADVDLTGSPHIENFYTEDQVVASGKAQVKAMKEILALFGPDSKAAEQMRDEGTVLVAVREMN